MAEMSCGPRSGGEPREGGPVGGGSPPAAGGPPGADAASSSGGPAADPLARVVAALSGAGLEPDAGELADALWLARWSRPSTGVEPAAEAGRRGRRDHPEVAGHPHVHRPDGAGGETRPAPPPDRPDDTVISLYPGEGPPGQGGPSPATAGLAVAVPEAAILPKPLELQSALRPLQRYRSPARPLREELDEPATAERTARAGGPVLPVFRPVTRGDAAMQLLMDTSSSMFVWERLLKELGGVLARLGAFREVRVRYLHEAPGGGPAVSTRFDPDPVTLRPVEQLTDPTGRRITLMVSDCAGPLWRSGAAHRLLHRLARHGPVAVLQPLPARLWSRTLLPVSYGVLHRAGGMPPSAPPRFSAGAVAGPAAGPGVLPLPVLPPTAPALGAWARLLGGTGAGEVPAAVGWVRADQPATHVPPRRTTVPVPVLVGRFRSAASPAAAQLAVHLSAAPLFLPVIRLVQRTMLPDSGPAELAEVLLSGLVVRQPGQDRRWYDFAAGVRTELLALLGRDEALLVLKHCSEYVEHRFGRSGPNFPALAIAQLTEGPGDPFADAAVRHAVQRAARAGARAGSRGGGRGEDGGPAESPQPFAEVAAGVLERFMPLPEDAAQLPSASQPAPAIVRRARELAARFEAEGMVQNLLDAVGLLRRAVAQERPGRADPELCGELARQLLRLWRLRGGADLLREAQEAADAAAAGNTSVPARAVRARVLQAAAEDRAAAGDERGALELLRRADREFTAVLAASGLDPDTVLEATLERVQVLEDQWTITGDAGLLRETAGMLQAFAGSWPAALPRPGELHLAHGRALLRLAGTARDREHGRVCAEQAARSFTSGVEALEREDAAPDVVVDALLSLVDAHLLTGGRLPEAQRVVDRALGRTRDRPVRASILVRAGRVRVARHAEGGPSGELEAAAGRFAEACRLTPRDRPEHRDLLAEWGAALLDRSALPGGEPFVNRAVLVLRDCRRETPESDPRLPGRLLLLGRALVLRYRAEQDLVDLREAEHVLGLAVQGAQGPSQVALVWYELGQTHRLVPPHARRPERLDRSADAYRRAAASATAAARTEPDPGPMVRLSAVAHHCLGEVCEQARRPRAAADAYRAALAQWRRLPDGGGAPARQTAERLARLTGSE